MVVHGTFSPEFEHVAEEFEKNFAERGEVGASVCVIHNGKTVVDLWGGIKDESTNEPWAEDTVSVVWSSTKGATALCAHILADRGLLDFDAPVADYWPEFGQAGKSEITVRMLLNHQAGLPAIRKPLPDGAFRNWDVMAGALAQEEPFWEPGTRNGYHALTFGWLIGELVRRISGKSLGEFFQDEVAAPLGIDFWIGLPAAKEPSVAKMILAQPDTESPFYQAMSDPQAMQRFALNTGGYMQNFDAEAGHQAEVGAAGGITNSRGLAKMYAALAHGGSFEGTELVGPDAIQKMMNVSSATGKDATLLIPTRFSLGFMKSIDNRRRPAGYQDSCLISEDAFGHPGNGGSFGFAVPNEKLSFAYTMNKMGQGISVNDRGQSLIDAIYEAIGYSTNKHGAWTR